MIGVPFETTELPDAAAFEDMPFAEVLESLGRDFPFVFLDSWTGKKREVGLAKSKRGRGGTQVYSHCLLLTAENDVLTTWAAVTSIRYRRPASDRHAVQIASGGGYSLFRDLDGWKIKLLNDQTVVLSEETMQMRGWRLAEPRVA